MGNSEEIKAFYENFSQRIQLNDFQRLNRRLEAIQDLCDIYVRPGSRVLEVGCGVGILSRHLLRRASHLLAVDLSEAAIAVARRHAASSRSAFKVLDIVANGEQLIDEGSFDAVLLADVIEHIPPGKRHDLLRIVERSLAPEGVVLLTYPAPEYQEHLRVASPEALQVVDETVELTDLLAETTLKPLYFKLCDVWCSRQYAHLVLARRQPFSPVALPQSSMRRLAMKLRNGFWKWRNRKLFRGDGDAD